MGMRGMLSWVASAAGLPVVPVAARTRGRAVRNLVGGQREPRMTGAQPAEAFWVVRAPETAPVPVVVVVVEVAISVVVVVRTVVLLDAVVAAAVRHMFPPAVQPQRVSTVAMGPSFFHIPLLRLTL